MHKITIVALGPGPREYLTLGALEALQKAQTIVLRTQQHDAANWLKEQGIPFESLDMLHEEAEDFDALNQACARYVLDKAQQGSVAYGVAAPHQDASVKALQALEAKAVVLPGVPLYSPLLQHVDISEGLTVCSASDLVVEGGRQSLCITEIDNPLLAGDIKMKLLPWYGEDCPVMFFPSSQEAHRPHITIPLADLDRQKKYDHTAACIIKPLPLTEKSRYDMGDLLALMRILRGENGCPWDRKQTHESLRPYLIEEAYETALAIDEKDDIHLAEELGDVLLQVALHAVIGEEYGTLDLSDIATSICKKMIARHRHVFGEDRCLTPEAVVDNWSRIKQEERGQKTIGEAMLDVKPGMPPLLRAEKIQRKARDVGFDWEKPEEALDKVLEEAGEVRAALHSENLKEEIGDLLFSCVNVARLCKVNSEEAVTFSTEKFLKRFLWMEKAAKNDGKSLNVLTINEMSVYWERSKSEM